jgi:hypothetical protein
LRALVSLAGHEHYKGSEALRKVCSSFGGNARAQFSSKFDTAAPQRLRTIRQLFHTTDEIVGLQPGHVDVNCIPLSAICIPWRDLKDLNSQFRDRPGRRAVQGLTLLFGNVPPVLNLSAVSQAS